MKNFLSLHFEVGSGFCFFRQKGRVIKGTTDGDEDVDNDDPLFSLYRPIGEAKHEDNDNDAGRAI